MADPADYSRAFSEATGTGTTAAAEHEEAIRDEPPELPTDAFKGFAARVAEIREFGTHYLAAKGDALKVSLRRMLVAIVFGVLCLLAVTAVLITSVVMLLSGIASAIGAAFDPPKPWVGQVIIGFAVIAGTIVGLILGLRKLTGTGRLKTVEKYESKHQQQRQRFGRDVADISG